MIILRNLISFLQNQLKYFVNIFFFLQAIQYRKLLKRNLNIKNSFINEERCFIVGSGSSLNNVDTKLLETEVIIGINAGYLKKDVVKARIKMWIIIDYFFLDPLPLEAIKAIEDNVGEAMYFIPVQAQKIVERYNLFSGKQVYYLFFSTTINNRYISKQSQYLNLHSAIFKPIGSVETAILCARYLGIKSVNLIGCDSDWFARLSDEQRHFFRESENEHSIDSKIPKDWVDHNSMESKLLYGYLLYKAYRLLNELLKNKNDVVIYNASGGGLLDVFPLIKYESLFKKNQPDNV